MNDEINFKDFKTIPVWKDAHRLALMVYVLTKQFPKEELFGLTSQVRRSSTSVPANIVEGLFRNTTKELVQFLYNSRGSAGETIYHLVLAHDLGYITDSEYDVLILEYENVIMQLNSWVKSLKKKH
jgi:four helix bundle protein